MRGSPFFLAVCMVAAFLLAGVPVYRLTRPAAVADAAAPATGGTTPPESDRPGVKPTPLEVEAVFAPAPADFQIKNLGQTVLEGHGPQGRFTAHWAASVPPEGVDLVFQAYWLTLASGGNAANGTSPVANPAAARLIVRFADGRQVEKSFWAGADGTLTEVFTVPGAAPAATP